MKNKFRKLVLVVFVLFSSVIPASAYEKSEHKVTEGTVVYHHVSESSNGVKYEADIVYVRENTYHILNTLTGNVDAIVSFGIDFELILGIDQSKNEYDLQQTMSNTYVSPYDVWQTRYDINGTNSYYKIDFTTQATLDMLVAALAFSISKILQPQTTVLGAVVSSLASSVYGWISNNSITLYYKKKYRLNTFCPILGQPKIFHYKYSNYTYYGGYVIPPGVAEWYGGTPWDYTQPFECRDLVLQYPM